MHEPSMHEPSMDEPQPTPPAGEPARELADRQAVQRWAQGLRPSGAVAMVEAIAREPDPAGAIAAFGDEAGHRRPVDAPLLAWLAGVRWERGDAAGELDVALWDRLASGVSARGPLGLDASGDGPLQGLEAVRAGQAAIEVWTERELSAIQALWTLGVTAGRADWRDRALEAARWCVRELQPDNATQHPWGLNAFVWLGASGEADADLYAQTLVVNATVGSGLPGRVAGLVMLAAGRSLELALRAGA